MTCFLAMTSMHTLLFVDESKMLKVSQKYLLLVASTVHEN